MILSIYDVKPGMKLEKSISAADGKTLLSSGSTLTIKSINTIKSLGITQLYVVDRNSVFISPTDMMHQLLIDSFQSYLRIICPKQKEANLNDEVMIVANLLEKLIVQIADNDDLIAFLVEQMLIDKDSLFKHSIYTAVLSGIVAGSMQLSVSDISDCICGALLHHIGMCEMPMVIGKSNLNGQQLALYHEHPTYGYYFAIQKNIPRNIADCILYHHEKWNGSGYPKGISGSIIPLIARIVCVCSHYTSSIRFDHTAHYLAIEELYGSDGIYFDHDVVQAFIRNIPVYPLGAVVRLSTKEVGIVSNIRKNEGPRPVVKVYYNRVNKPITDDKIVDLGKERTLFIEEIL